MLENATRLLSDQWGEHIPQIFAREIATCDLALSGLDKENLADCLAICRLGVEQKLYWEAWRHLLKWLEVDVDGQKHCLYHDGELWLVPIKRA